MTARPRVASPAAALALTAGLAWVVSVAGCAQFGVPDVPPPRDGDPPGAVFVAYDPDTVLGLGHTGVIVPAPRGDGVWRFDQYASAEIVYGRRLAEGRAWFWEGLTARVPSIFGRTRELVTRRRADSPLDALAPGERLLSIPGLDAAAVRAAAQARHVRASRLEAPTAPRYFWVGNNCQHFVRDVLRAGGPIHERYFPKTFVAAYVERGPPGRADRHWPSAGSTQGGGTSPPGPLSPGRGGG